MNMKEDMIAVLVLFSIAACTTTVTALEDACQDCLTVKCIMEPNRQPPGNRSALPISGYVTLKQRALGDPTFITVRLRGASSYMVHGFHIHTYGDIVTRGCQSAGSHYNPYNKVHAGPRDHTRHVGDLGNVMSDYYGNIRTTFMDRLVSLTGSESVLGRSIVLHAKRDDLGRGLGKSRAGSLKTGNAGARLACCVIVHAP